MQKTAAIAELNRRGANPRLTSQNTRFANAGAVKHVWWLDLPLDDVFDESEPATNLVLVNTSGALFHLRVLKQWLSENIAGFAIRHDKGVISLELSCESHNLFQDIRPRSGRHHFARFRV